MTAVALRPAVSLARPTERRTMIALAVAFPLVRLPLALVTGGSVGPVFGFSPLHHLDMLIDRWWVGQVVEASVMIAMIVGALVADTASSRRIAAMAFIASTCWYLAEAAFQFAIAVQQSLIGEPAPPGDIAVLVGIVGLNVGLLGLAVATLVMAHDH